jgi:hypothetical protein
MYAAGLMQECKLQPSLRDCFFDHASCPAAELCMQAIPKYSDTLHFTWHLVN